MVETFYRFLGGPRTFWSGRNTTIIKNNFYGAPMMPPMMPHRHCFGGGNNWFGMLFGFSLLSNLFNNNTSQLQNNYSYMPTAYTGYQPQGAYTGTINDLQSRIKTLEKEVEQLNDALKDTEAANSTNKTDKSDVVDLTDNSSTPVKPNKTAESDEAANTSAPDNTANNNTTAKTNKEKAANTTDLQPSKNDNSITEKNQEYVNSHISNTYTDKDGNKRYDITAIVHDGDTIETIQKRFYTDGETPQIELTNKKLHTQKSETHIVSNPLSGATVTLKGVSDFGIEALAKDGEAQITSQGEITKTNKRISDLVKSFKDGTNKLSKAYVLQNNLMTEAEYNKVISEKY